MKNNVDDNKNIEKYFIIAFASAVIGAIGYLITKVIMFGTNAYKVYPSGSAEKGIVPNYISFTLWAIIILFVLFTVLFLKPNMQNKKKICISLVCCGLAILSFYLANANCVAFNDNEIIAEGIFKEKYENVTFYKVKYASDGVGEVIDYRDSTVYIVKYGNKFYQLSVMPNDSVQAKELNNQLKIHNIKIITVETPKDIPKYKL